MKRHWSRTRRWALPAADVLAVSVAVYLTFALRFEEALPFHQIERWLAVAALPLIIRPISNHLLGMYAHSWRFISVPELLKLVAAVILGTLPMAIVYGFLALTVPSLASGFPRSFWILETLLSAGAMTALRLAPRMLADIRLVAPIRRTSSAGTPTILYGAGEAGAMMARAAFRQPAVGVRPVAFLDDDRSKWGERHAGVQVMGSLPALKAVAQSTNAEALLITMPAAAGERIRAVADAALELGLRVQTVPSLDEMFLGSFDPHMIRQLHVEDLLRRPPVSAEALAGLAEDLADETVLVTGAGGSIGSELARQLAALNPRRLVLLDRAEGPLYELQREFEARNRLGVESAPQVEFTIGDVTHRVAMARLLRSIKPGVVFHAAAYKHVPIMENHPLQAVDVNVGGTLAVLDAAAEVGVERFVLVSTDKAVEPSNVMGATKRLAELLVAEFGRQLDKPWVAVRFGNVLGSSGSVVPIFQKQLEAGEPLTVTDEQMTRYFMTIPEAVHLILQAATLARPADLFVLDMGEPVRIIDLARDLIRLSGRDSRRTRIQITGPRPGEKLHERLFYEDEAVTPTAHPKVFRVPAQMSSERSARAMAEEIIHLSGAGEQEPVRSYLMACVEQQATAQAPNGVVGEALDQPRRRQKTAASRALPEGASLTRNRPASRPS